MRTAFQVTLALACAALLALPARGADKTDVVVLSNGDRLTGDIKELDRGELRLKTDFLDTVYIEWGEVASLVSKYTFQLEIEDGTRYFGTLVEASEPGRVKLLSPEGEAVEIETLGIVRMAPIESRFWKRLDGSLGAGFSLTSSSDVKQLSFAASASARTRKYEDDFEASSIITDQESGKTSRHAVSYTHRHLRPNRWYNGWLGALERNDELGIDLRTLAGGGVGRFFLQTNQRRLDLISGVAVNEEWIAGQSESQSSTEAFLGAEFEAFRFKHPEMDFDVTLDVFPGLSEWGRVRANLSVSLRREIVKDFFVNLSLLDSFDNQPPGEDVEKYDYSVVMNLEWTF